MGIIWPEPREIESEARVRSVSLKRVLRIAGQGAGGQRLVWLVEGGGGGRLRRLTFFAEGTFPSSPAESLSDCIAHGGN